MIRIRNDRNRLHDCFQGINETMLQKKLQPRNHWSCVQSCRFYYDFFEGNTQKMILLLLPSLHLTLSHLSFSHCRFFLLCSDCLFSFYNFFFSLTARQIASRSMNFLERSCDCLPMFLFFFFFLIFSFTFTFLSLLSFEFSDILLKSIEKNRRLICSVMEYRKSREIDKI